VKRANNAGPILVSIATLDRSSRPVLRKAASLAKLYQAPLRIVHVLAIPQGALERAGPSIRAAARADLDSRTAQLEKLARIAELRDLEVSASGDGVTPVAH
jgi:universal stress protein E